MTAVADAAKHAPAAPPAAATSTPRALRAFRAIFLALVYTAVAAYALNAFHLKWGLRDGSDWAGFDRMMDGTAHRPVAFRVLVPQVAKHVAALLPERPIAALVEHNAADAAGPKRASVFVRYGWKPEYFGPALVAYFLQFASLLVTLVASRRLVVEVLGRRGMFADFAPAVGMLFLPLLLHKGGYVYDYPELMFCSVGFLLLWRQRFLAWYVCFALAVLNKEADVLLANFFLATQWRRLPFRAIALHAVAHVLLGGAILVGLRIAFAENGGAPQGWNLPMNVAALVRPSTWAGFVDYWAPFIPFPRPYNLISLFLIGTIVAIGWRAVAWEVRVAFVAMMVCLVPLTLITGFKDEVRNFSLAFVPFCLMACEAVSRAWAPAPAAAPDGAPAR
jgi:hypothetical protein